MKRPGSSRREADPSPHPTWPLGQAKARFSEVVRLARSGQPQRVTVHGKDAVVIAATPEFDRLTAHELPANLHELLSNSPLNRVKLGPVGRQRLRRVDQ